MRENGSEKLSLPAAHHSVLAASIPAIVHRANNCLSVIDGTIALMQAIDSEERAVAAEQSAVLKELLKHLAFQARTELEEIGEIEVAHLLADLEFVVGVIGRFRHCDVELRQRVRTASVQGDRARIYRLLVSMATERVLAMFAAGSIGSRLRIGFLVRGKEAHLTMIDTGGAVAGDPALWNTFAEEARALDEVWEFRLDRRVLGNAHAIRLSFPVLRVREYDEPIPVTRMERILLVQEEGEDADLFVTVLSEQGYRVEHLPGIRDPQTAEPYDLVLCDDVLLPTLPPILPRVLVLGRPQGGAPAFGVIEKPIKPKELIERVSGALN